MTTSDAPQAPVSPPAAPGAPIAPQRHNGAHRPLNRGPRKLWHVPAMHPDYGTDDEKHPRKEVDDVERADVIGAQAGDGRWYPALDIDWPCQLVESETPGHHHLLIDVGIEWEHYRAILEALGAAGILNPGYVSASIERYDTFIAVRPWKFDTDREGVDR